MKKGIGISLIGLSLATGQLSDAKAENFVEKNKLEIQGDTIKSNLYKNLSKNNSDIISFQGSIESITLIPIDARLITDAALSYFDEEVKLYSLKGEERKQVETILMEYLSSHPILKKSSDGKIWFIIDDKKEFAKTVKNLANTLFDGMPKVIRDIAVFLVFGGNEELQKKLDNLDSTVMDLSLRQYRDIVFDYFGGVVKRICSSVDGKMTVRDYYNSVHKYYPNKNHNQLLNELNKTGQLDNNMTTLKYPFKK